MGTSAHRRRPVIAVGAGVGYWRFGHRHSSSSSAEKAGLHRAGLAASTPTPVGVVQPQRGGLPLTVEQVGSVHSFEMTDLYAEVTGYLKTLRVDYGDRVKAGDILAEITAPDLDQAEEVAAAALELARAKVGGQMPASTPRRPASSRSRRRSRLGPGRPGAAASRTPRRRGASTSFVLRQAVESKLEDEEEDRHKTALAATHHAEAQVKTARADVLTAKAQVETAKANLAEAKANVDVAQADLDKARVWVAYTKIRAPYDGVITQRNFFQGAWSARPRSAPSPRCSRSPAPTRCTSSSSPRWRRPVHRRRRHGRGIPP